MRNMGSLCCKDIPNINLSCINNGMVSSCCKNSVEKNLKQQHFISGSITYLMGNPMNPIHGIRPLIGVMRMHCVMLTQTHKMQYIFTSTDGLWELHQCCFTKDN